MSSVSLIDGHIDDDTPRMTEKEIIKGLACCSNASWSSCHDCPCREKQFQNHCAFTLSGDALDLIKRQQAEIEELEAEIDKQYEQAEADILGNLPQGGASCHWCIDKHKAYAIKEFAERLILVEETTAINCTTNEKVVRVSDIVNLVKEMVGADNGR